MTEPLKIENREQLRDLLWQLASAALTDTWKPLVKQLTAADFSALSALADRVPQEPVARVNMDREWCEQSAKHEAGHEVGAGCSCVPHALCPIHGLGPFMEGTGGVPRETREPSDSECLELYYMIWPLLPSRRPEDEEAIDLIRTWARGYSALSGEQP